MNSAGPFIVTGATGFVGQRLMRWLTERGLPTFKLDLRAWRSSGGTPLLLPLDGGAPQPLNDRIHATLIHLAWCPPVRDDLRPHADQLNALAGLLQACGAAFDRVVGIGSAEEYGWRSGLLSEVHAVNENLSAYGWGKRSAQMLLETWNRQCGTPAVWLRPFLVYGEGQGGNMAIPYALRQVRAGQPAEFSAGSQRRDFVHVDDVVRAIMLAASSSSGGFTVANVGTGVGTGLRAVLERLGQMLNAAHLFQFGVRPMRPGEPEVQIAATAQAEVALGFKTAIGLDDGLKRVAADLSL